MAGTTAFLGLTAPTVTTSAERFSSSCARREQKSHFDRTAVTMMSYAKKNKKKKKLVKKGLIKKPEDTRLLDLPIPDNLEGSLSILWFRKDLRLRDNECLQLANTAECMIPLYVFDTRDFGPENLSMYEFEKTSVYQSAFLVQSVDNLRRNFRMRGTELYIRTGRPEEIIANLSREYLSQGINVNVIAQKEVTKEETTVEFLLQRSLKRISTDKAQAKLHLVWGSTLHHIQDLPYTASNLFPVSFTTFKMRIDRKKKKGIFRYEIPIPDELKPAPESEFEAGKLPSLSKDLRVSGLMEPLELEQPYSHPWACFDLRGGEDAALARMDDYIWKKRGLLHFQSWRHGMGTTDFSTKFSPFLALGCVSPRTLYWEATKFEELHPRKEQKGSFQLEVQLQWRDFFRLTAIVYKNQMFARDGLGSMDRKGRLTPRKFGKVEFTEEQKERALRWMNGETGIPFIDAGMRELKFTGYMSNRLRQNCASYLVHDLRIPDWRFGAEYFQSKLIDYDVTSNWMGWQYVSSVSNDSKHGRRYPVLKQAVLYDASGWFVRRWVRELVSIPEPEIHVPFLLQAKEQEAYEVTLGETYPYPAVPPWRIPQELDRPTEMPKQKVQRAGPRRRRMLDEEDVLEELKREGEEETPSDADEFDLDVDEVEYVDVEDESYEELLALEDTDEEGIAGEDGGDNGVGLDDDNDDDAEGDGDDIVDDNAEDEEDQLYLEDGGREDEDKTDRTRTAQDDGDRSAVGASTEEKRVPFW